MGALNVNCNAHALQTCRFRFHKFHAKKLFQDQKRGEIGNKAFVNTRLEFKATCTYISPLSNLGNEETCCLSKMS